MFEDEEYTEPAKAFKEAGHELIHIGLEKGKIVISCILIYSIQELDIKRREHSF